MRVRTFNILILLVIVSVAAAAYIVSRSADDPRFEKIGQPVFRALSIRSTIFPSSMLPARKGVSRFGEPVSLGALSRVETIRQIRRKFSKQSSALPN